MPIIQRKIYATTEEKKKSSWVQSDYQCQIYILTVVSSNSNISLDIKIS
jgi:hypothetical protein